MVGFRVDPEVRAVVEKLAADADVPLATVLERLVVAGLAAEGFRVTEVREEVRVARSMAMAMRNRLAAALKVELDAIAGEVE